MMIYVNSGAMQDEIVELLENADAKVRFHFIEKRGIRLCFGIDTEDADLAVDIAKKLIKESPLGKSLYFQVVR